MANRKKAKEEKTPKSTQENVTSNIEKKNEEDSQVSVLTTENQENNELNKEVTELPEQELKKNMEFEKAPELKVETPKLYVLADDRLNSLINRANELGITDVIQILNSDKFGQFYLVYRK